MIKYPDAAFEAALHKQPFSICILTGQEDFLLNTAALTIKKNWRQAQATDAIEEKRMSLEHPNDWHDFVQEATSYALFYDQLIIDATWNKKNFDAKTKVILNQYADHPSPHCLLILRAPLLTAKQCADFNKHKHIACITIQTLNAGAQINWIKQALKQRDLDYTDDIPQHIQTYTHGNLHAAHQTIERLALAYEPQTVLTLEAVKTQLLDERQFKLYEISGACLDGHPKKALELTQRARLNQVEPILILWFITQELRLLEQIAAGVSHQALKIYSFRAQQYQRASKRLSRNAIYQLLKQSQALDTQIKSGHNKQTWLMTEQLILNFSDARASF